jgi:hypothetical protein
MKQLLTFIFALCQVSACYAQQFEFPIFFVDAAGNKDTLLLGYDPNATDEIDNAWGEQNIYGTPYKTGLDVRTGNEFKEQSSMGTPNPIFETKKQIMQDTCGGYHYPIIEIHIATNNYPVQSYWDHTPFLDSCYNGSVVTAMHPGTWWWCGTGFVNELFSTDSGLISPSGHYLIDSNIQVYWAAIGDFYRVLATGTNDTAPFDALKISPNPSADFINIQAAQASTIKKITIHNAQGQPMLQTTQTTNIDIRPLPPGFYYIKTTDDKGRNSTAKFCKNQ